MDLQMQKHKMPRLVVILSSIASTALLFFVIVSPAFAVSCRTVGGTYTQEWTLYGYQKFSATITAPANLQLSLFDQAQRNMQAQSINVVATGGVPLGVTDNGVYAGAWQLNVDIRPLDLGRPIIFLCMYQLHAVEVLIPLALARQTPA
jgi:hypothetical protein